MNKNQKKHQKTPQKNTKIDCFVDFKLMTILIIIA